MTHLCFNVVNHSPVAGGRTPLRDQIAAAAAAGFPLIGIDLASLHAAATAGGGDDRVAGWLAAARIGCGAITCAGMLGTDPPAGVAGAARWARALGAPFVQVNMAAIGADQRPALEAACDAAGNDVRLALEYMPFTPLDRVADAVALVAAVGLDRAGVLIDVWHHERGPDSWDDLAAVPAAAIAYAEFDDALPAGEDVVRDTMDHRIFPGEGMFDLPRFVRTIAATGYRGMVSVEVLSAAWRTRDVGLFAAEAFTRTRGYWLPA